MLQQFSWQHEGSSEFGILSTHYQFCSRWSSFIWDLWHWCCFPGNPLSVAGNSGRHIPALALQEVSAPWLRPGSPWSPSSRSPASQTGPGTAPGRPGQDRGQEGGQGRGPPPRGGQVLVRHNSDLSDILVYTNCFKICGVRRIKADRDRSVSQPSSFQTKSPATFLTCTILRTPHLFL